MRNLSLLILSAALLASAGCSKHDCALDSEADKKDFAPLAEATSGASSCFVSNDELVAVHGGTDVAGTAEQYKSRLEKKGYTVEMKDYAGKRANGKELKGKALRITIDGKKSHGLVYQLGDEVMEVTLGRPK